MSKKKKPDLTFIGIGAAKSGTTWLANYLREHPQVYLPHQKEIGFFDWEGKNSNYNRGFDWYKRFFRDTDEKLIKGEFTTHYMYFKDSHKLIKRDYPNIKLIACLRNPVDLAYSLYWWKKANYETVVMEDTFEEELANNPEYKERGLFYKQLSRYFKSFPRENIKIIIFDDIKSNPKSVIKEVCDFLAIGNDFLPENFDKKVNRAKKVRFPFIAGVSYGMIRLVKLMGFNKLARTIISSRLVSDVYTKLNKKEFDYPKMDEITRNKLKEYFSKDIDELESLIGRDLSSWK